MRIGLIMSALLHVGILAWAFASFQSPREFRVAKVEPMAVNLITADELTRLKQGSRTAKQKDAVAKKRKKKTKTVRQPKNVSRRVVKAVKPPPPSQNDPIADALAKLPKPEPKGPSPKELKKQADAKAAAKVAKALAKKKAVAKVKKLAEAKKKALVKKKAAAKRKKLLAAKRKKAKLRKKRLAAKRLAAKRRKERQRKKRLAALAKKKKNSFNADKFAALLNKLPDDKSPAPQSDKPLERRKKNAPGLGAPEGTDDRLSASEVAVLKSIISRQLAQCWSLPGGGGGSQVARVTLSWRLSRDGMLDGEPRVISGRNDVFGRIAQEAAIRAVKTCVPFRLPPDKYSAWKQIEWEFDPRQML